MLQEMFGEESVPKMFKGEKLHVEVDGKRAYIDLLAMVSLYHCTDIETHDADVITTSPVWDHWDVADSIPTTLKFYNF